MAKRIIKGKAYNTETATKVGSWRKEEESLSLSWGEDLYQNRFGQFFIYRWGEDGPDGPYEDIVPLTPKKARDWMVTHESWRVDVIESLFGAVPEAGSKELKYTLRLPVHLHRRCAEHAEASNQSLNAWMVKALENATYMLRELPEPNDKSSGLRKFALTSVRFNGGSPRRMKVDLNVKADVHQSKNLAESTVNLAAKTPNPQTKPVKPFPGVLRKPKGTSA